MLGFLWVLCPIYVYVLIVGGLDLCSFMHVGECMHDWERASEVLSSFDGFGLCGS